MTLTSMSCICCGSTNFIPHLTILLRCSSCGHISANLDLDTLNSKDIYSIEYFQQGEYLDYIKDQACFEKNFRKRLKSVLKYQSSGHLLEIGSASGFFLNMAKKHFATTGYEICEDMANYAKMKFALDIKSTDFLKDNVKENAYDVVAMWDCIEHLARPDEFFKRIQTSLKKGGIVALTTGDIGSFMARLQGRKWRLIHPPTHVHYFTQSSMTRFLESQGFEVLQIQYPGYYRSLRQMLYGVLINRHKGLWNSLDNSQWGASSIYLNLYDIMQVIARKI